jgi:hypothetical protein
MKASGIKKFVDEQFLFRFIPGFQTPIQNFDFGLFEFGFKFEIAKIQCCSNLGFQNIDLR